MIGATKDGNTAHLWDVVKGEMLGRPLNNPTSPISELELDSRGSYLAVSYEDRRIVLWDAVTRQPLLPAKEAHRARVGSLAFSTDTKILASADDDGIICFWDTSTRLLLSPPVFHMKGILRLVFSNDGKILVSGGEDGSIKFWGIPEGRPLGTPIIFSVIGLTNVTGYYLRPQARSDPRKEA